MIGWRDKTPEGFVFALKIPQEITHERVLVDCEEPCRQFFQAVDLLEDKLGPLLFQFGYFHPTTFQTLDEFMARLIPFLDSLPKGYKFAVEIRNKNWLRAAIRGRTAGAKDRSGACGPGVDAADRLVVQAI